jgi:hypothetical protein
MQGFSFASLILSYFLVGGGMFTGTLAAFVLKTDSQVVGYLLLAAGGFVGGFVAARASRGSTVLEAAIGAIAVVGTIVGMAATTVIGKLLWAAAQDQTVKFVAAVIGAGGGGALVGAFLSEKLFGESTTSSVPWVLYTALSTFGACLLALLFGSIIFVTRDTGASRDELGGMLLGGMAVGCLLAGLAVGASARTRPLLAALVGGGAGVLGFFTLMLRVTGSSSNDKDQAAGMIVLAVGGCLVTLIGALIGWLAVGKRHAG